MADAHLLTGITVVDFTQFLAGPVVTQSMAEMGAEVIKVELAPLGDQGRYLPTMKQNRSGYFIQQNTAKKSLCLDINRQQGKSLITELLKKADVMVENFSPGVIAKLGFGWEAVHQLNPRLVMCSVSAFGQTGPLSRLPGFDFTGQAYAGVASMVGDPDGAPALMGVALGDVGAGMSALAAINAALFYRERTGTGTRVESSLLDFLFRGHEVNVEMHDISGGAFKPNRCGSHSGAYAPVGYFKAKGGYVGLVVPGNLWPRLCAAMSKPELERDPRFADNELRVKNVKVLVQEIEDWMQSVGTVEEVVALLTKQRIPGAPVLSVEQAMKHPHLIERQTVRTVKDPVIGDVQIAGMPISTAQFPRHSGNPAPLLGEHNLDILSRHLGYSVEQVESLSRSGVLLSKRI